MSHSIAIHDRAEFRGLAIGSSSLMIKAKAHQAKDEPFDAAVAWINAGNMLIDLSERLVSAGCMRPAVEELLNAAECFLEAGDHRPADRKLERLGREPFAAFLAGNEFLTERLACVMDRSRELHRRLDDARNELRRQMGDPDAANKLRDDWLADVLDAMPGVADFHWFKAQKALARSNADTAIEHLTCCVRLSPFDERFWVILVLQLDDDGRSDDAIQRANEALAALPRSALIMWVGAWARIRTFVGRRGTRALLDQASRLLEALELDQLSHRQAVCAIIMRSYCLEERGQSDRARSLLQTAVRDYPVAASVLAWRYLRARGIRQQRQILNEIRAAFPPAAA